VGKDARAVTPLESQAEFTPGGSRDPVGLLLEQARSRVPELVPVRHGRMLVSPFTFYPGALPMAADLARHACLGAAGAAVPGCASVQFGAFASPERRLVFDVNDFDETLPGPFEWDVKRWRRAWRWRAVTTGSAAKPAARLSSRPRKATARRCAPSRTRRSCRSGTHLDIEQALGEFRSQFTAKRVKETEKMVAKARTRDSTQALGKLTTLVGGRRRIISDPPMIVPVEEIFSDMPTDAVYQQIRAVLGKYRRSLQSDRRHLLGHFTLVQVARKVVGSAASVPKPGSC
jgi:hypothetical protein